MCTSTQGHDPPLFLAGKPKLYTETSNVMKTNSFQDPLLPRAIMGRKRIRRHIVKGIPVRETVEYRIARLRKELGMIGSSTKYQLLIFGEWKDISREDYEQCLTLNMNVRKC